MTTRHWPYTLPGHSIDGFTQAAFPTAARTDFDSGAARSRRRTLAQRFETQITWNMTNAEFSAFQDWYHGRLVNLTGSTASWAAWFRNAASRQVAGLVGPEQELADALIENTVLTTHFMRLEVPAVAIDNVSLALHVSLKAAGRSRVRVGVINRTGTFVYAEIDLALGVITASTLQSVQLKSRGNGWWAVSLTENLGAGAVVPQARVQLTDNGSTTYLGDGVSGVGVAEVMLRIATGFDLYIPCDASGRGFGSDGEAGWFLYNMPLGGGLTRSECRFMQPYQSTGKPGFHWTVSAAIEVRYA